MKKKLNYIIRQGIYLVLFLQMIVISFTAPSIVSKGDTFSTAKNHCGTLEFLFGFLSNSDSSIDMKTQGENCENETEKSFDKFEVYESSFTESHSLFPGLIARQRPYYLNTFSIAYLERNYPPPKSA